MNVDLHFAYNDNLASYKLNRRYMTYVCSTREETCTWQ